MQAVSLLLMAGITLINGPPELRHFAADGNLCIS